MTLGLKAFFHSPFTLCPTPFLRTPKLNSLLRSCNADSLDWLGPASDPELLGLELDLEGDGTIENRKLNSVLRAGPVLEHGAGPLDPEIPVLELELLAVGALPVSLKVSTASRRRA